MSGWTGHEEWMRDAEAIAAQSAGVSDQDRTIPERLDDAETGAEFGAVIQDLFKALEKARDDEDDR